MRHSFNIGLLLAATAAAGVIFTGCRKDIGFLKHPGQNCEGCNIEQITVNYASEIQGYTISYVFSYNSAGDPVIIKNSNVTTGNPNTVFHYDKHGRLTEMIRPYDNESFEVWTRYEYNNKYQIIRDTQIAFGTYVDSIPVPHEPVFPWIHEYGYDAWNRIIAVKNTIYVGRPTPEIYTDSFKYDANGNLVRPGVQYDNHPSLLLTNRIWPFISRNYSLNNGFPVTSYNRVGLPATFQGSYEIFPLIGYSGLFTVTYACR